LPFGQYWVDQTVVIRGNVRRIVGMNSLIHKGDKLKGVKDAAIFGFGDCAAPAVVLEFMKIEGEVQHASNSALVLRHCYGYGYRSMRKGCGPLFIEDTCSAPFHLEYPQKVFARQLNMENPDRNILNNGATLWILGMKTERPSTVIETKGGGWTELLGGLIYPCKAVPTSMPMFVNNESSVSLIWGGASYVADGINKVKVRDTRDGRTIDVEKADRQFYCGYKSPPPVPATRPGPK
jgi:hypothetical protein